MITHSSHNYPGATTHRVTVFDYCTRNAQELVGCPIAVRFTGVTALLVHSGLDRFDIGNTRTDCKSAQASA